MDPGAMILQWLEYQQLTPFSPLLLCFVFFFLLFLFGYRIVSNSQKLNLPPSPPRLPIIGNLHQLGPFTHRYFRDLSRKYGPVMLLYFGSVPVVVVSSREMAREVMKTNDTIFANRPVTRASKKIFYGPSNIAFSSYGEYWRQLKKICYVKLLSGKKVQSFRFVREETIGPLVETIFRACSTGRPINMAELTLKMSQDIISRCTLGRNYGEDNEKGLHEIARNVSVLLGSFSFQDFFPGFGWLDYVTGFVRRLNKTANELDAHIDEVIVQHIEKKKLGEADRDDDFVYLLLQDHSAEKLDLELTRENMKAVIVDLFIAGIESTSTTIEWTLTELMKNPRVMKKLQEEVRRVVGKKHKVEEEDIPQMEYLTCVIKETLRLHLPGPTLLPRKIFSSFKLGGYDLPPNSRVVVNVWAIQRDPEIWSEADKYIPERFMNKAADYEGQSFDFMPFGAGRRICPGLQFALVEIEHALANILYWFDWKLPGDAEAETLDMSETPGVAHTKKIPLELVPSLHFPKSTDNSSAFP